MKTSYWAQVDVVSKYTSSRFFMQECSGEDIAVRSVMSKSWLAHEPPLPHIISCLSSCWHPVFIDIHAGSGFYSLLASVSGAHSVCSIEPNKELCHLLKLNKGESPSGSRVHIVEGTSKNQIRPTSTDENAIGSSELLCSLKRQLSLQDHCDNKILIRIGPNITSIEFLYDLNQMLFGSRATFAIYPKSISNTTGIEEYLNMYAYTSLCAVGHDKLVGTKSTQAIQSTSLISLLIPDELLQAFAEAVT